jgi:hypothetical protein
MRMIADSRGAERARSGSRDVPSFSASRYELFLVRTVEKVFVVMADGFVTMRVADDAIDVAGNISAADVANDRFPLGGEAVRAARKPIMILDHGLDPAFRGKCYAYFPQLLARIPQKFQIVFDRVLPEVQVKWFLAQDSRSSGEVNDLSRHALASLP